MKITYLTGCTTCNDGVTDHINQLIEDGMCSSVAQAVREVTEMLNEDLGYEYFKESTIRSKHKRVMTERGKDEKPENQTACTNENSLDAITELQADSVTPNGPLGFTASDSQEPLGTAQGSVTEDGL